MPESQGGFSHENIIVYKLGQIESSQTAILENMREAAEQARIAADKMKKVVDEHDTRIRSLETSRTKLLAYMAAITTAILFVKEVIVRNIFGNG